MLNSQLGQANPQNAFIDSNPYDGEGEGLPSPWCLNCYYGCFSRTGKSQLPKRENGICPFGRIAKMPNRPGEVWAVPRKTSSLAFGSLVRLKQLKTGLQSLKYSKVGNLPGWRIGVFWACLGQKLRAGFWATSTNWGEQCSFLSFYGLCGLAH